MKQDTIVVLDLGSTENARLIDEIRALGVSAELHPHDITLEQLNAIPNVKGVILNGGPDRVVNGEEKNVAREICNAPLPVLMVDYMDDAPWPGDEMLRAQTLSAFVLAICGAEPG